MAVCAHCELCDAPTCTRLMLAKLHLNPPQRTTQDGLHMSLFDYNLSQTSYQTRNTVWIYKYQSLLLKVALLILKTLFNSFFIIIRSSDLGYDWNSPIVRIGRSGLKRHYRATDIEVMNHVAIFQITAFCL